MKYMKRTMFAFCLVTAFTWGVLGQVSFAQMLDHYIANGDFASFEMEEPYCNLTVQRGISASNMETYINYYCSTSDGGAYASAQIPNEDFVGDLVHGFILRTHTDRFFEGGGVFGGTGPISIDWKKSENSITVKAVGLYETSSYGITYKNSGVSRGGGALASGSFFSYPVQARGGIGWNHNVYVTIETQIPR